MLIRCWTVSSCLLVNLSKFYVVNGIFESHRNLLTVMVSYGFYEFSFWVLTDESYPYRYVIVIMVQFHSVSGIKVNIFSFWGFCNILCGMRSCLILHWPYRILVRHISIFIQTFYSYKNFIAAKR